MWIHVLLLVTANIFKVLGSETRSVSNTDTSMTNNLSDSNNKDDLSEMLVDTINEPGPKPVVYGSEGNLTCNINSSMPMHIDWFFANVISGKVEQIVSSDKYSISADGTSLKIKNMDLDMVGKYICKATIVYGQTVKIVLIAPNITGNSHAKTIQGSTAVVECKIIGGLPTPKITWQFMSKSSSKFAPIAGSDSVLRISSVQDKHAGRYKCVAENSAGKDDHVTTLIVQELPKITTNRVKIHKAIEGDASLNIPCAATGFPKPVFSWTVNGRVIIPGTKYSIVNGTLVIRDLKVSDTNFYTCEAINDVGSDMAKFKTHILQVPKVSGGSVKQVRVGTTVSIECTVLKGEPKPKITWQFMSKSSSKFAPIAGSDSVLRLSGLQDKDAGRYKCVAENAVGKDEHVTTLIVEFAPRIISTASTVKQGMQGDIALRIPCDVVAFPIPVITWKLKGNTITPNVKYSIDNGALVIMNPTQSDSTSYTCEAKNNIGSVNATFRAEVYEFLNTLGISHNLYILKGETKKLKCEEYTSESQSVRWFIGEVDVKINNPFIEVVDASLSDDGNYTCRVSDKSGHTHTHTYVVDVGYPPRFYEQIPVNDWRGDFDDILYNCENDAKPTADVQLKFNGEVITNQNFMDVNISHKWGNYSCISTNVHGSIQRSFNVQSSVCLINRHIENDWKMPLLLMEQLTWPKWETTKHYTIIEQGDTITLYCPNNKEATNTFQQFPKESKLKALCNNQDKFSVDGKLYKLSDLKCNTGISPSVIRKKVKCFTETSELMKVGYNVEGLLETYEVCFDHARNMPLYARMYMTKTDGSLSTTHNWYKYPGLGEGKFNSKITCKHSYSSCCYGMGQLVNAQDFNHGLAKNSTFIDPLNLIPTWRPCFDDQTTWEDVDSMVRTQLIYYDNFMVWSGTHTFEEKHGASIPRFLWKVLRFNEEDAIAIVHVNDPSPTEKDIKCKNICTPGKDPWFKASDTYTYCCSLTDFLVAFHMQSTNIGENSEMTS